MNWDLCYFKASVFSTWATSLIPSGHRAGCRRPDLAGFEESSVIWWLDVDCHEMSWLLNIFPQFRSTLAIHGLLYPFESQVWSEKWLYMTLQTHQDRIPVWLGYSMYVLMYQVIGHVVWGHRVTVLLFNCLLFHAFLFHSSISIFCLWWGQGPLCNPVP